MAGQDTFGVSPALGGTVVIPNNPQPSSALFPSVTPAAANGSGNGLFTNNPTNFPNIGSFAGTENVTPASAYTNIGAPASSASNDPSAAVAPSAAGDGLPTSSSASVSDLLNSAGSSDSSSSSSGAASVPTVTFLDNIANEFYKFAYHIKFFASPETGSGPSVVIAESGVTGFNISSLILNNLASAGATTSVALATTYKMVITEPLGTSFLDALKGAAAIVGISNSDKAPYHISITFKGYDENGNPSTNACSTWPNGGVWNYTVFIGKTEFHVTPSGTTYTIDGSIIAMTGLSNPAAARTQQVTAPVGTNLGELLTSFIKQLNDSPANKGLFKYSVAYQDGQLPNPSKFKFSQSPSTDVATMRGYREADKMKSIANFPPGSLIVDAISSIIGATVEGQKYIVNSDGSLQPGATSANNKYRDAGLYRVLPTASVGDYDSKTNNYSKNIVYNIKGSKVQNTSIDGSESNSKNGPSALTTIAGYGGIRKRYMYNFTGLNTEVLELNTTFSFNGVNALPAANGANYYTDNVRQGAAARSSSGGGSSGGSGGAPSALGGLLGASTSIANIASTALGAGGSFGSAVSSAVGSLGGVASSVSNAVGGLSSAASSALATSGGFGGVVSSVNSLTSQVASLINNGATTSTYSSSLSGGLSAYGGDVYMEDLLPIATETNQTSTIQSYNSARLNAGSGTPTQGNSGKSVFGAIVSQITGFNSSFMTTLGNFKIKGDPYWLGMDHDTMVKNTDKSGNLPDHTQGDICFLLNMQFPYNWAETGNTTFLQNQQFTGVYRVTTIDNYFTNGIFTQILTATRVMGVDKKYATELLAKSTVQSSLNLGGASGSSSSGGVGSFVSGLGSLNSGGSGTSIPTTQSGAPITTAAPTSPVITTPTTVGNSSMSLGIAP